MSEQVFPVPADWKQRARVDSAGYERMSEEARRDPVAFWGEQGMRPTPS